MPDKAHVKTKKSINTALSLCKVNKYMSSGQLDELDKLKRYKIDHDGLTYDDGDNWFQ